MVTDPEAIAYLLADPTRRQIIDALSGGPMRSSELAEHVGATPAALSRHLNQLRTGGIIQRSDVEGDGRGRRYQLCSSPLEQLADWIERTTWSSKMASTTTEPEIAVLLARLGGFLDAFAEKDVSYFDQHLRDDAILVFPGADRVFDKSTCIASVETHPSYRRHEVLGEPTVQRIGVSITVITVLVDAATSNDAEPQRTFICAVIEESEPWQLVHLQWTSLWPLPTT